MKSEVPYVELQIISGHISTSVSEQTGRQSSVVMKSCKFIMNYEFISPAWNGFRINLGSLVFSYLNLTSSAYDG